MSYHVPVMVQEVVEGLIADISGTYLDATAGGGGHSQALLGALGAEGRLIAVDRDWEAVETARKRLAPDPRAEVWRGSFAELGELMRQREVRSLLGALFDLGVSSHQIDEPGRGFSYQEDGPLDMRMNPEEGQTAAELVAASSEEELADLIKRYGEERQARRVARSICWHRDQEALETTQALRRAIAATRPQILNKTLARVFQALRIAVNDELGQLQNGLEAVAAALDSGGRLVVIAYHSLEDRLVKRHFEKLIRGCICPPRIPVCICGLVPTFKKVGRKPLRAGEAEVRDNSRARSAVLRIYEKIEAD